MSTIRPCRKCGADVATHVERCPGCGTTRPGREAGPFGWKPLLAVGALLFAVLLALFLAG